MKLALAKRFLSPEEVAELRQQCTRFWELYPLLLPDRNITRQVHDLIFNVPQFAEYWGTIGLMREQEGHAKHASINSEM